MLRKFIAGTLIAFSTILLGLSIAGISFIWMYKGPLDRASIARIQLVDRDLRQAQTALQNAKFELERTLRIVESAEKSMSTIKAEFTQAKILFGDVNGTLGKQLIPGLKASRVQIDQAKSSLVELQVALKRINALLPFDVKLSSDKLLSDLISSAGFLDAEIAQTEDLVKKAPTFIGDASYLMESDFTETRSSLQKFLLVVQEYDLKLGGWRDQLASLVKSLPAWINTASIALTIFLAWFGLSQLSVIRHGLTFWREKSRS